MGELTQPNTVPDSAQRLAHGMRLAFDEAHERVRTRSFAALSCSVRTGLEPAFLATVSASYPIWAVGAESQRPIHRLGRRHGIPTAHAPPRPSVRNPNGQRGRNGPCG